MGRRQTCLLGAVWSDALTADGAHQPEHQHDDTEDESGTPPQQLPSLAAGLAALGSVLRLWCTCLDGRGEGFSRAHTPPGSARRTSLLLDAIDARGFIHARMRSAHSVASMYTITTTSTPATSTGGSF